MRFLQRFEDLQQPPAGGDGGVSSANPLQQARAEADRLLAAGDEAIHRALGGANSEAFLRASMQQSGE
jgi:hypothetical protein